MNRRLPNHDTESNVETGIIKRQNHRISVYIETKSIIKIYGQSQRPPHTPAADHPTQLKTCWQDCFKISVHHAA